jgi:hypothetical protein
MHNATTVTIVEANTAADAAIDARTTLIFAGSCAIPPESVNPRPHLNASGPS